MTTGTLVKSKVSCIILAGGKGARMGGADKGLLRYRNKRLIEHVIDRISPQLDDIVISANRHMNEYRRLGYAVVSDHTDKFDGPLAGIASALPHCRHQWVLVIPCDMPELPDNLVETLWRQTKHSSLVCVSSHGKRQLIFLMNSKLLPSINNYLADNQHTVMRWLDAIENHAVVKDNDNDFNNINKAEQLDA
ncbi:MAG: molybdenum cofactor guanylyltransferase MobA [Gammaproteobacteria bacterium]